ncbi:DNA polymerase alpha catalytic subunit-like [Alosa pseudoharengus]|uniref:DNA polymerase alpha catalytic subunit-like n=1 Tax=Alosa pseudoharengus TaxID=34774 RepID=UPI003F89D7D1
MDPKKDNDQKLTVKATAESLATKKYSEKALYNQLSFYRFIFDWDYAFNKVLTPEDRAMAKGRWALERQAYKKLKDVVDRALASSSYSEVNLAKLFQAFTALK